MASYAPPITGVRYFVRAQLKRGAKYYGAYPAGFLEFARTFLGVHIDDPVLHVCAGLTRLYPYPRRAIGPNDRTLDLNPAVRPDFLQDARDPWPPGFKAAMCDGPYSELEAANYPPGARVYPSPRKLLERAMESLAPGQRVGILHYKAPRPPPGCIFLVEWDCKLGFENMTRVYSVYEKTATRGNR